MNLFQSNLSFDVTPPLRETHFYASVGQKILIANEGIEDTPLSALHEVYKSMAITGIPFHFFVAKAGMVYLLRPRIYSSEFGFSYMNPYRNAIMILLEGALKATMTDEQIAALPEILTMIAFQDNVLPGNIAFLDSLETGVTTSTQAAVLSSTISGIGKLDPYRSFGDTEKSQITFRKMVVGAVHNTYAVISKFTGVPTQILISMNQHITLSDGRIPFGTTVFLPDNPVTGYLESADRAAIPDICKVQLERAAKLSQLKKEGVFFVG